MGWGSDVICYVVGWRNILEHDTGIMLESEKKIVEMMDERSPMSKYWMPLVWATNIINRARRESLISSDQVVQTLLVELSDIRRRLGSLISYDTVCVPLVYTQVSHFANTLPTTYYHYHHTCLAFSFLFHLRFRFHFIKILVPPFQPAGSDFLFLNATSQLHLYLFFDQRLIYYNVIFSNNRRESWYPY